MSGEFIHVRSETWREMWLSLIDQDGVSDDIFCVPFREIELALRKSLGEEAANLAICDLIQLREAFDRALSDRKFIDYHNERCH
jgi:hypothetical protein